MVHVRFQQMARRGLGVSAVLLFSLFFFPGMAVSLSAAAPAASVAAWGFNERGALGDGTTTDRHTPVQVVGPGSVGFLTGVRAISGGSGFSLALKQDGTVWTWGANDFGALGDGTTDYTPRTMPGQVLGPGGTGFLTGVQAISAGFAHSLALKQDGAVWAWGANGAGELGDGTSSNIRTTPVHVEGPGGTGFLSSVQAVSTGASHSLALKQDGTVWAWGWNSNGQLGVGTADSNADPTPAQVLGPGGMGFLTGVQAISGGGNHCLALKRDGTVWAWGDNHEGDLGDGTITERHTPVQVLGPGGTGFLSGVQTISAGYDHSLALKQDGTVWAWGNNLDGELGFGTADSNYHTTPVQAVGPGGTGFLTGVRAISGGDFFSLALKRDGAVWAWGANDHGELGDGTTTERDSPVQVVGFGGTGFLTGVHTISAGNTHGLAIVAQTTPFDFNGDGQADLLWQNQATGGVYAWLMNGTQYSGAGGYIAPPYDVSTDWRVAAVADFNGDGSPDIVWQNSTTGGVYVWFLQGLQYSGQGGYIIASIDPSWKIVGAPDLNGDGQPDLLWQNTTTGGVYYWLMNGLQFTGQGGYIAQPYAISTEWKIVATPDFNGDASPDILWQNSTTGGVYVWYMNGTQFSGNGAYIIPSIDLSWRVVGVPDLNGDGQPDLLWQNSTTGGVYYWPMSGATYTGQGGYIIGSIDLNWQIVGIH